MFRPGKILNFPEPGGQLGLFREDAIVRIRDPGTATAEKGYGVSRFVIYINPAVFRNRRQYLLVHLTFFDTGNNFH